MAQPNPTNTNTTSSSLPTTTASQQTLQQQQQQSKRRSSWWFKVGCIILIIVISIEYLDWNLSILSPSSSSSTVKKPENKETDGDGEGTQQQICSPIINNINNSSIILSDFSSVTLHPGELPGYTGWARPEFTVRVCFVVSPLLVRLVRLGL